MIEEKIGFRLTRDDFSRKTNVHVVVTDLEGKVKSVAASLNMEAYDVGSALSPSPAIMVEDDILQSLMDQLWRLGIKPSDYVDNRGQVTAMAEHISDMRMVVKKAMKID